MKRIKAAIAAKTTPFITRTTRRSKRVHGFIVTGPDGQFHVALSLKAALVNLLVRVRVWQPVRWTIKPLTPDKTPET